MAHGRADLEFYPYIKSNLCGIVFYGAVPHSRMNSPGFEAPKFQSLNASLKHAEVLKMSESFPAPMKDTKVSELFNKHTEVLLKLSQNFEDAVDLSEIRVCVVNEGGSSM